MITKVGAKVKQDAWLLKDDIPEGITSTKLLKHMNKKYGLTVKLEPKDSGAAYQAGMARTKKGNIVYADPEIIKRNPYVIGHEVGHAVNHSVENSGVLAPLYGLRFSKSFNLIPLVLGIGGAIASAETGSVKPLLAGTAAVALQSAVVLADEYTASQKSNKAMRELGAKKDSATLSKAFWKTYVPFSAIGAALPAYTYGCIRLGQRTFK